MALMPVTDSIFLLAESREHPMHVGGLELFAPPPGAGPDFAREVYDRLMTQTGVNPLFRKRPGRPVSSLGNLTWAQDTELDLEYHVRRSALPAPGRIRELLEMVSRLHGSLLDRHRPLWEMHVIEGLEDGRVAVYTKIHHAMLDGVSALRTLQRSLSTDPEARDCPAPWGLDRRVRRDPGPSLLGLNPLTLLGAGARLLGEVAGLAPATLRVAGSALREDGLVLPMSAPRTMFNVSIGGARRFAAQSWSYDRLKAVRAATGATLNDVVLAMCSGALRRYLLERGALPDAPLIAMVPVSMRALTEREEIGGNAVSSVLCNLGTHLVDPLARLAVIRNSMSQAKAVISEMTPLQSLVIAALTVAPLGLSPLPGFVDHTRPPFNVVISNVPGPRETMYWNGARLDGIYPMSIAMDGQALNITLASNGDSLDFGVVGCRTRVPHLQRILLHLENTLAELEKAVGAGA
ncbi:wax ester/triacylglycerol synthase family O-acyltransferase [Speluncibacter jeojiensis]|uniref:Diacylglycerol O-acyltransferase n=1 Tax=Speluncibacter jeojiensis TaxID=2710754 RepID=A0A9X4M1V8_9ACTN|nr:wax ester/triacylglycerol synthase family O-acyltransferase [Corynebacteriales bacterium D3-21]